MSHFTYPFTYKKAICLLFPDLSFFYAFLLTVKMSLRIQNPHEKERNHSYEFGIWGRKTIMIPLAVVGIVVMVVNIEHSLHAKHSLNKKKLSANYGADFEDSHKV